MPHLTREEYDRREAERHNLNLLRPFVLAALPAALADAYKKNPEDAFDVAATDAYLVAKACLGVEQDQLDAAAKGGSP